FTPHSSILSFRRLLFLLRFFFFHCYGPPPDLHSFPTRRSSDLVGPTPAIRATRPLRADAVAHASGGDPDAQGRAPAVRRRRTLLSQLVSKGPDAGDPACEVGGAGLGLGVGRLAQQSHHAIVGTHLDVGVLEPPVLLETPLHRLLNLVVLQVDRLPLHLRDDLQGVADGLHPAHTFGDLFRRDPFRDGRHLAAQDDDAALRLYRNVPGLHAFVLHERHLRLRREP